MGLMARIAAPQAAISSSRELERAIRSVYGVSTTSSGIAVNTDSAMRVGAVYACVLVLSQSVAQLPCHLYKTKGDTKQRDAENPLYQLIHDQPNEWMTSYDFKQLAMVHLLLRGNSIWLKTVVNGTVKELIPVHPDLLEDIVQDENYRIIYKIKRPKTQKTDEIPASRLLHLRGLSMNGFTGLNPIAYAREMIGLSIATEKHGATLFSNGTKLGGILKHPNKISPAAAQRLEESFSEKYGGVANAHKTVLLEEGMEWTAITMTAEDSQFLESRKYQRSEIAGFYRVPSHMINDLEKATFSNVEHLDLAFVKHSLTPWLVNIEQTLKKDLMTTAEKKKLYFKFNVEGLLRGDIKSRNEAHQKAVDGGWLSPNEIREMEDRNPYPGGDEYRKPLNMGTAGGDDNEPQNTATN